MTENTDTVDLTLVLSFEPDAIRGHYEGDDPDPVAGLTDDELRVIGHEAIADDRLYRIYCQLLDEGVERTAAASGGATPRAGASVNPKGGTMDETTIVGIANTINDREEAPFNAVYAWMKKTDLDTLLDGFDVDLIDWYFAGLEDGDEGVQEYPRYDREVGPAIDRISDAFNAA